MGVVMGGPRAIWDAQGAPSPEQPGPYTYPAVRPVADRSFTATSTSRYKDQWARDDAPWQENWAGNFKVDEGSEEEDDALSYHLPPGETEQIWGLDYVDFGAIYCRHVKGLHFSTATSTTTIQLAITDMQFDEWLPIFMAFQREHLRTFP